MATFNTVSQAFYDASGTRTSAVDNNSSITSADIDDGFWNVGDNRVTASSLFEYAGFFVSNGHQILVFESASSGTFMHSATGLIADYPATYVPGSITLTTTPLMVCFAAGTKISTPSGETNVEDLRIGDRILTRDGKETAALWIGMQTVHRLQHGPRMQPVRIRAGALGGSLPHCDLTVTADHGMVLDGYVINASALVNGDTIDWVPMAELEDSFTVYHIETEAHDVILANGAPAETFIDYLGRRAFDNYAEYLDLYGSERIIRENPMPRISAARLLPASVRARLGQDLGTRTGKVA